MPRQVFISYSSSDRAYVQALARHIRAAGMTVWYDDTMEVDGHFREVVEQEIQRAAAVVVVMTPTAAASQWVRWELDAAIERGKPILPLIRATTAVPLPASTLDPGDVTSGALPDQDWMARLGKLLLDHPPVNDGPTNVASDTPVPPD